MKKRLLLYPLAAIIGWSLPNPYTVALAQQPSPAHVKYDQCVAMPILRASPARHQCFAEAARLEKEERAKNEYTISLYSGGVEVGHWTARGDVSTQFNGVEFTDGASGKRLRLCGTVVIESNNDQITGPDDESD